MSVTLWSLHDLGMVVSTGLLDRMFAKAVDDFPAYTPQQRSMTVTALTLYSPSDPEPPGLAFLDRTVQSFARDLPNFKLQVCTAVAVVQLVASVQKKIEHTVSNKLCLPLTAARWLQEISAVMNACSALRFDPGAELITAAAREVINRPLLPDNEQVSPCAYQLCRFWSTRIRT